MSQDRLHKIHIWTTWRLVSNLDILVFKPLCDSCVSVSNCDTGSPPSGLSLIYPVRLYNFLLFFEQPCHNWGLFWYVFDSNWNYLRLHLVWFYHWTSYVQSPWPLTCLWLRVCGVVHTPHIEQCENPGWTHDTVHPDVMYSVYCFYSSSVDHWEVFLILPTHVSKHVWLQVLNRSESLITVLTFLVWLCASLIQINQNTSNLDRTIPCLWQRKRTEKSAVLVIMWPVASPQPRHPYMYIRAVTMYYNCFVLLQLVNKNMCIPNEPNNVEDWVNTELGNKLNEMPLA